MATYSVPALPKIKSPLLCEYFVRHYTQITITNALIKLGKRTRRNRRCAFSSMWRILLINKQYAQTFRNVIANSFTTFNSTLSMVHEAEGKVEKFYFRHLVGFGVSLRSKSFNFLLDNGRLPYVNSVYLGGFESMRRTTGVAAKYVCFTFFEAPTPVEFTNLFQNISARSVQIHCCSTTLYATICFLRYAKTIYPNLQSLNLFYYHVLPSDPSKCHSVPFTEIDLPQVYRDIPKQLEEHQMTVNIFQQVMLQLFEEFLKDVHWCVSMSWIRPKKKSSISGFIDGLECDDDVKVLNSGFRYVRIPKSSRFHHGTEEKALSFVAEEVFYELR